MQNYKFRVKNIKKVNRELCVFMKVCKECGQLKLLTNYHRQKKARDGRTNVCKECRYIVEKSRHKNICIVCGKEFTSQDKKQKFCSLKCVGKWNSENLKGENSPKYNRVERECDYCGQTIYVQPNELETHKYHFCNLNCRNKWIGEYRVGENSANWQGGKVVVKCSCCGKDILRYKCEESKSENYFCSKECEGKWKSENTRGENSWNYNPNLTEEDRQLNEGRHSDFSYKRWRDKVFKRDDYTCQLSGKRGGKLNAHHLNGWNWDKEHRNDIDNGITLCEELHKLFHKLYGKGNNTREQFEEFKQRYYNGEFREVS